MRSSPGSRVCPGAAPLRALLPESAPTQPRRRGVAESPPRRLSPTHLHGGARTVAAPGGEERGRVPVSGGRGGPEPDPPPVGPSHLQPSLRSRVPAADTLTIAGRGAEPPDRLAEEAGRVLTQPSSRVQGHRFAWRARSAPEAPYLSGVVGGTRIGAGSRRPGEPKRPRARSHGQLAVRSPRFSRAGREGRREGKEPSRATPKGGRKGPRRRARGAARGGGLCPPTPRPTALRCATPGPARRRQPRGRRGNHAFLGAQPRGVRPPGASDSGAPKALHVVLRLSCLPPLFLLSTRHPLPGKNLKCCWLKGKRQSTGDDLGPD